ncbi:sortase B protein-sorting domain-containing protein [Mucilaginibacter sp. L196]
MRRAIDSWKITLFGIILYHSFIVFIRKVYEALFKAHIF